MKTKPFLLHALSSLHAGVGSSAEAIDLPIARMKATGIPFVPGSSIKGVLREARREQKLEEEKVFAIFGPSGDRAGDHAGALVVGDARLLAIPVRSFKGTFAWVSSPLLLLLAARDLDAKSLRVPSFEGRGAKVTRADACSHQGKLYLQDLVLPASHDDTLDAWVQKLAQLASPGADIFTRRFAVVDDDTMTFLWETATQVDARVRIDADTRTVATGALWQEESLPSETLLIGLLAADRSRNNRAIMTHEEVLTHALANEEVLQFGGKASIGRGRCRMIPM
jgi:CRISPR-associated protein Cmr4